jgi:hypothetical protein
MNKTCFFLAVISLGESFIPCAAQSQSNVVPKPPTPPYVAPVGAPAGWTIKVTYRQSIPTSAPASEGQVAGAVRSHYLTNIQVTKTAEIKREIYSWSDGTETERWFVSHLLLYREPQFVPGDVAIFALGHESKSVDLLAPNFSSGDFPTLAWINEKNYLRQESRNGYQCFYFESNPGTFSQQVSQDPRVGLTDAPIPTMKAWIAADTKLPVAVDTGATIQEYTYSRDGPRSLTLPPMFANKLGDYLAKEKAAIHLPPHN